MGVCLWPIVYIVTIVRTVTNGILYQNYEPYKLAKYENMRVIRLEGPGCMEMVLKVRTHRLRTHIYVVIYGTVWRMTQHCLALTYA